MPEGESVPGASESAQVFTADPETPDASVSANAEHVVLEPPSLPNAGSIEHPMEPDKASNSPPGLTSPTSPVIQIDPALLDQGPASILDVHTGQPAQTELADVDKDSAPQFGTSIAQDTSHSPPIGSDHPQPNPYATVNSHHEPNPAPLNGNLTTLSSPTRDLGMVNRSAGDAAGSVKLGPDDDVDMDGNSPGGCEPETNSHATTKALSLALGIDTPATNIAELRSRSQVQDTARTPKKPVEKKRGRKPKKNANAEQPTTRVETPPLDLPARIEALPSFQASWMCRAIDALMETIGKRRSARLVDLWVQFESLIGYQDMKKVKLSPVGRPFQISDWTSRRRKYNTPPPVEDQLSAYGSAWRTWWASMQPDWRGENTTWPLLRRVIGSQDEASEGSEWAPLLKGGENGMVLALLSLSWWLAKAKGKEKKIGDEALDDACWVLEQLIAKLSEREEGADDNDRPRKKRR